jgi:hypothetical protein
VRDGADRPQRPRCTRGRIFDCMSGGLRRPESALPAPRCIGNSPQPRRRRKIRPATAHGPDETSPFWASPDSHPRLSRGLRGRRRGVAAASGREGRAVPPLYS